MEILNVTNLTKTYGTGGNAVHALKNACLTLNQGEFLAVVGTSGSGKSTFLKLVSGLDSTTSVSVAIRGMDIARLRKQEWTIFRRRGIGFIFQNYSLIPVLNMYDPSCVTWGFGKNG